MNDFKKEDLESILEALTIIDKDPGIRPDIYWCDALPEKICYMIENFYNHDDIHTIGTGQLLFHNKDFIESLINKISRQLELCENQDETKCFRIDWKIMYGKKTAK